MSAPVPKPHYPLGSTCLIKVHGIREALVDQKLASIDSVTAALYDSTDTLVTGSSITMEVSDEEDDVYAGRVPHSITLTHGQEVRILVTVTGTDHGGNVLVSKARHIAYAEYRGFHDD